jgi:hypothetical protein
MKIFILNRTDSCGYDEYDSKVVVAKTAYRARKLANEHVGDEGQLWTDTKIVKCEQIKTGFEHVILESFNAG